MRILVLGGTAFLSREVAAQALRRGHEVSCAARGRSGGAPDGARFVSWDRADAVPAELAAGGFDAVVDVSGSPAQVRRAVAAFPRAHWTFVSTVSVYRDPSLVGATAAAELVDPLDDDAATSESYGSRKVACERLVRDGAAASFVVRPGLIVGPGDGTGRFAYWPAKAAAAAADGQPVLVPGAPADPVQLIDVRDLAAWIVEAAESRLDGCFDAVCPPLPRSEFLDAVREGSGSPFETVWATPEQLAAHEVAEWAGPRSIPLWIGDPGYRGFMAREVAASLAAGLRPRPVSQTVRDTLAWLRAEPAASVTGLTRAQELEVLARMRA